MYEYIKGEVEMLTPACAVIEAGGVGYFLNISLQTYTQLGDSVKAKLYTHYVVREDAQMLYGFASREEREVFRHLIGVSGVGGNTARMILSTFSSDETCGIIATGQAEVLKRVKGLGIKTAQKIIVELRDKIGMGSGSGVMSTAIQAPDSQVYSEALSALVMLGFAKPASDKVLRQIIKESPLSTLEDLIRLSLKRL